MIHLFLCADYSAKMIGYLIILFIHSVTPFSLLDLNIINVLLEPEKCDKSLSFVTVIHSAPENLKYRTAIRKTWGKELKRVFVLGQSSKYDDQIKEEYEKFGDILQFNFVDAYRNMTYKHLSAYW